MELLIYRNAAVGIQRRLEAVYAGLLAMEEAILDAMQFQVIQAGLTRRVPRTEYLETITDEDRLPLTAVRDALAGGGVSRGAGQADV
jgi:hypothetical protein